MPEILITIVLFMLETSARLASSWRRTNPQILREKYYEKKKQQLKILESEKEQAPNADFLAAHVRPKLDAFARRYILIANLNWGRDLISRYKAAWCNVLTAESCEIAEDFTQAGRYFHFAAHGFRELGEFDIAGDYYHKSAECLKHTSDYKFAIRSCNRAIAVYQEVQETSKITEMKSFLKQLMEKYIDQTF